MPYTFSCSADDLLGLIASVCGLRWNQKARVKTIRHLMGGHIPIFSDGQLMKEDAQNIIPGVMQRFNELLDDIYYKGILPDTVAWGMSQRWKTAAQIIFFGKEHRLTRADWGKALAKKL